MSRDAIPEFVTKVSIEALSDAFRSNDDLGIVLRVHLEIESAMIRVLEEKFPKYGALKHQYFAQHLRALRSLGARGGLFQIADVINKIRNRMAHVKKESKTSLTMDDLNEVCSQAVGVFGGRKDVLEFRCTIGANEETKLRELPLGQQFAVIGFMTAAVIDTIPQREAAPRVSPE